MVYFGTEDRSEKSVRAEAGRVSTTWGEHDQSGANFEVWSCITSTVEGSWKTRCKMPVGPKPVGLSRARLQGSWTWMQKRRRVSNATENKRPKGVEEMKRRTPLMFRSRIARPAVEDLKTARRLGFRSHAKSAAMFRTGSDGKKSS